MGYPHPDVLLEQLTSYQLTEWEAYCMLEPFGPLREDVRFGILTATTANCSFAKKKDKKPFMPNDFFPPPEDSMDTLTDTSKQPKKQSVEDMRAALMSIPGLIIKKRDKEE